MNWNSAKPDSSDLGKKDSLPNPGEAGQVSSWQERFCQSYKSWSESNDALSGIYKALSSQKFLKHITCSRLDSPVLSQMLFMHILIKIQGIWEGRPEDPKQEHTRIPFHVPEWEFNVLDWNLGFLGGSDQQIPAGERCCPSVVVQNWVELHFLCHRHVDFYLESMLKTFTTPWLFPKISLGFKIILFSASVPPLILCIYIFPIDGTGISCFLRYVFVQIFPVWGSQVYFLYI